MKRNLIEDGTQWVDVFEIQSNKCCSRNFLYSIKFHRRAIKMRALMRCLAFIFFHGILQWQLPTSHVPEAIRVKLAYANARVLTRHHTSNDIYLMGHEVYSGELKEDIQEYRTPIG